MTTDDQAIKEAQEQPGIADLEQLLQYAHLPKLNAYGENWAQAAESFKKWLANQQLGPWQPIETAPRDGTQVLIVFDRHDWDDYHSTDDPMTWQKVTGITLANHVAKYGHEWWEGGFCEYSSEREKYTATHWMPIPEAPKL